MAKKQQGQRKSFVPQPKTVKPVTDDARKVEAMKAMHNDDDFDQLPEGWPNTHLEKVGYANHCILSILEDIPKALKRLNRFERLLRVGTSPDDENKSSLPDIITRNEARMAIEALDRVHRSFHQGFDELMKIFTETGGTYDKTTNVYKT